MAGKKFRSWVGFREEEERTPLANPVDRIRDLESQLADLRSRRDITGLSREEFEILATETAMVMIKSAQAREAKANAAADRIFAEASRSTKDTLESSENKARSILAGAESRGRKYISTAEAEASEIIRDAAREAAAVADAKIRDAEGFAENKRREGQALTSAARREAERIIQEAAQNVTDYHLWLGELLVESERLYRGQTSALTSAESAIAQSREKLDTAFARLARMQSDVDADINPDGTVKRSAPIKVESKRARTAISAPKKKSTAIAHRPTKNSPTKNSPTKKSPAKRK